MEPASITAPEQRQSLLWSINLSLGVGILMLVLKFAAYWFTGSSAILSDAAESIVHVVAVAFAAYSLRLSFKPADASHPYGHSKISFFSAGVEGALIAIAALFIIYSSVRSWMSGVVLANLGLGTVLTFIAVAVNGILGAYLIRAGRRRHSLILVADAHARTGRSAQRAAQPPASARSADARASARARHSSSASTQKSRCLSAMTASHGRIDTAFKPAP